MDGTQANNLLDAAARCATATESLFEALQRRNDGDLTSEEAVTVTADYIDAKEAFDNSINTRGML